MNFTEINYNDFRQRVDEAIFRISIIALSRKKARKDLLKIRQELYRLKAFILEGKPILEVKGEVGTILVLLNILGLNSSKKIRKELEYIQSILMLWNVLT
ncbi:MULTISPECIES: hypothetical protein [Acidianus]|uniref:Uncharacterized protein n=1 Tax=Candidatus Acidianus copahuensis TaxID=1160895 RepID=A0A031LTT9_9CREN|nr:MULTISPECIES: hypothetical protein [Acidianus]EZQ11155.1 hypothetical protein CM19_02230 [Candidatus Acidianus copahuensis]NON62320.1 hypothetical protein [Acidianus sp. RZ1]